MPVHNSDIALAFDEIANLLEIQGENPFRIRAYRNASRTIGDLGRELHALVQAGEPLTEIPGIGKDLALKITEFVQTGRMAMRDELRATFPAGVNDLLRVQGLGPKRVKVLWKDLGIESLAALGEAAKAGRVKALPGFGEKIEKTILQALASDAVTHKRFRRASIVQPAEALRVWLSDQPGVRQVTIAGSYRRLRETVGDLDYLAVADNPSDLMARFVKYDDVTTVLANGDTKSSVVLRSGIQCDLRVVPAESYGAALQYFTGSQAHNIATRAIAAKKKLKLNEYGLMAGETSVAGRTEEGIYEYLGLPFIPPELREDRGEIQLKEIPRLVALADLKGDLHNHSTWSDGTKTIAEMAAGAKERGLQYIAITDHSKRLAMTNGLDEARLREQIDEIRGTKVQGIEILAGIEVDILEDGALDLSDDVLGELDLVVASVHSKFNLPREKQTERILRAMDHPHFSILGHPTGRLILSRDPYEVDVDRIIAHARDRGCYLELNANPHRLDLNDVYVKQAKEAGVLISIDCDGHSVSDFANLSHGINQARRGWLGPGDVLNTRSLKELKPLLRKTMSI